VPETELSVEIDLKLAALGGTTGIAFSIDRACPTCHGRGRRAAGSPKGKPQPCTDCQGTGHQSESRRLNVRIPAGVDEGSRVRVRGEGAMGPDGRRGDLVIEVHVKPHPFLRRHGDDLEMEVPITLEEAVKGAKITLPTLESRVTVTVPPHSQTGSKLRLRGQGATRRGQSERGDLYVTLQLALPSQISPEAEKLLVEFGRLTHFDPRKERGLA
jgi:molecular chaperone DnaJ